MVQTDDLWLAIQIAHHYSQLTAGTHPATAAVFWSGHILGDWVAFVKANGHGVADSHFCREKKKQKNNVNCKTIFLTNGLVQIFLEDIYCLNFSEHQQSIWHCKLQLLSTFSISYYHCLY